jgi:hypothetical protein
VKKLTLSECAQLAEVVAAVAVVMSLIYVGIQVNVAFSVRLAQKMSS